MRRRAQAERLGYFDTSEIRTSLRAAVCPLITATRWRGTA
jgi:hypothetical protein